MGASFDFLSTKMTNKEILQKKDMWTKIFFLSLFNAVKSQIRSKWMEKERKIRLRADTNF
jgi:hypothetical protein